jgi:aspartyl-tRNA synthetase
MSKERAHRSHYCEQLNTGHIGESITVSGWVHRRRDHGGVIFIDLRDASGILQLVFDPSNKELFAEAEKIRSEYVLSVSGSIRHRPEGTVNSDMITGEIELLVESGRVLNPSLTPPFHHDESANEDIRLKYRYLDLRRQKMSKNLKLRHQIIKTLRNFLDAD